MSGFDATAWELFLRKMISHNFKIFGISDLQEDLEPGDTLQLCRWNMLQSGLHNMLQMKSQLQDLGQTQRNNFQFELELK